MFKSRTEGSVVFKCTVRLLEELDVLECEFQVNTKNRQLLVPKSTRKYRKNFTFASGMENELKIYMNYHLKLLTIRKFRIYTEFL